MKVKVEYSVPIAYHYTVNVKQCLFCSMPSCLCNQTFQDLVNDSF